MGIQRRDFLKIAGAAGCALLSGGARTADAAKVSDVELNGMLIDSTKCIGCRACEEACNAANALPKPEVSFSSEQVFETTRDTGTGAFTVVNRFPNPVDPERPVFVRKQCNHCNQPACATACLVKALEKHPEGPVVYNKDRCMGCRYCMISCPFDVPKYEYDSAMPYVRKCVFCHERVRKGEQPACSEACPEGATLFGKRRELMEIARERIYKNPDRYHPRIYGEHEAGGTAWLFLSGVPFEQVGFRGDIGSKSYPEMTTGFLYAVPHIFILWPTFLFGLSYLSKRGGKEDGHGEE